MLLRDLKSRDSRGTKRCTNVGSKHKRLKDHPGKMRVKQLGFQSRLATSYSTWSLLTAFSVLSRHGHMLFTPLPFSPTHTHSYVFWNPNLLGLIFSFFPVDVIMDTSNTSLSFQVYFMKTQLRHCAGWHKALGKLGISCPSEASSLRGLCSHQRLLCGHGSPAVWYLREFWEEPEAWHFMSKLTT